MNQFNTPISKPPDNFQTMLKESIDRFLCEYQKGVTDFSNFTLIFSRLLQNLPDPSLEYVWFYSALSFHTSKSTALLSSSKQVFATKDLFQLLVSCSGSCNVVKKIAMIGPVIYELYHLVAEKKGLKREVEGLLEGIVSYISLCCCRGSEFEQDDKALSLNLNWCFVDIVRVWVVDKIGENREFGDDLRLFLPIVSDKVREGVRVGCRIGYLAGAVMCEAFLLRLSLKFGLGFMKEQLEKDLRDSAVQMITGFRSYHFLDILLKMLLEPVLPVTSLLCPEDEVLLRRVLYDAVVTVEYSFPTSQRGIQLPCKNLVVTWLFVVDNALQSVRENGDQAKVISYMNAFSESRLPPELIKWVSDQIGMGERISRPNVSTPVALIKWLLILEDQGVKVFDCDFSKIYAKAVSCRSRIEYEIPVTMSNGFYSDNEGIGGQDQIDGDLEMVDFVDTEFSAVPGLINSRTTTDGTRKRKECRIIEGENPVKFAKNHFFDNFLSHKFPSLGNDDGLSSGSEVDNPVSDEDMVDMKQ